MVTAGLDVSGLQECRKTEGPKCFIYRETYTPIITGKAYSLFCVCGHNGTAVEPSSMTWQSF